MKGAAQGPKSWAAPNPWCPWWEPAAAEQELPPAILVHPVHVVVPCKTPARGLLGCTRSPTSMGHVPDVLHSPVPRPGARLTTRVTAEPSVHPWLTLTVLQLSLNSCGSRRPYRPRQGP